ncbi:UDP-N-acetylmuramate dehydrogenase [Sulfurihydrogenibium subterraneum]|uniref:UDP-N-acetylmuramate dehydrogenase n=1 Tax=Sulfurihydrogenibium subterraneum TaxID=171121 RepID=UPI00048D2931|nr:UDP-N-acetylmuramate dehydrogenase [Sulfurihydrogenibium subterraneum]
MIKIEHLKNFSLKDFCTIKVGGTGKVVFFPKNTEEISFLIKEYGIKNIFPLGIGSNLIFSDGFIDRVFIHSKNLKHYEITQKNDTFYLTLEAGVSFKTINNIVKKYNLEGFENLSGIPATVGGAVAMNAGAYGSEIFDILEEVWWIDKNGNLIHSKKQDIKHSYRYSQFQEEGFVYKAKIKLKKSDKDIFQVIKQHLLDRNKKQPLDLPTAGSTYKNPPQTYAGKLIEQVGLKGYRINDIGFSSKHANFLVNYKDARFEDLINLLQLAEKKVYETFGIKLEREVKIVE